MGAMDRTCPDCGVQLRRVPYLSSFQGDSIRVGADGIRGRLGIAGEAATAVACPDCGLVRFYVDPSVVE